MLYFIPKYSNDDFDINNCFIITDSKAKYSMDFYYNECIYDLEIPIDKLDLFKPHSGNSPFNFLIINDDINDIYIHDLSSRMTNCIISGQISESTIMIKCTCKVFDLDPWLECDSIIRNIKINYLLK